MKTFADDKLSVTQNIKLVFHRVKKNMGKRIKCWLPAFSPFPIWASKAVIVGYKNNSFIMENTRNQPFSLVLYNVSNLFTHTHREKK